MKVNFYDLFEVNDGSISPKGVIRVGGVTMSPGVSFGGGVIMGGFNAAEHIGKDLEVEQHPDGVVEIKGVYP